MIESDLKLHQATQNRQTIGVCSAQRNAVAPSSLGDDLVGYSSLVGELWHSVIYNDTAREFVRCAQISALVVVVIKEWWDVKNGIRNRLE